MCVIAVLLRSFLNWRSKFLCFWFFSSVRFLFGLLFCFSSVHFSHHFLSFRFFPQVDGVVYLIDVSDEPRIAESKVELDGLLGDPDLAKTPVCILGNKIDKEGAVSYFDSTNEETCCGFVLFFVFFNNFFF